MSKYAHIPEYYIGEIHPGELCERDLRALVSSSPKVHANRPKLFFAERYCRINWSVLRLVEPWYMVSDAQFELSNETWIRISSILCMHWWWEDEVPASATLCHEARWRTIWSQLWEPPEVPEYWQGMRRNAFSLWIISRDDMNFKLQVRQTIHWHFRDFSRLIWRWFVACHGESATNGMPYCV